MSLGKIVKVTGVKDGLIQIVGAGEHRKDIPIVGGIDYIPQIGKQVLIVPFEDTFACVGDININMLIKPGEKYIHSSGGYIYMKNSGDIEINGLTITKDGQIKEAKSY